jgi:outer membrane lipoprotein carrier protein
MKPSAALSKSFRVHPSRFRPEGHSYMSIPLFRAAVFSLLYVLAGFAPAADTPEAQLRRFVDGVKTMTAHFEQTQANERGEPLSTSTGQMILSRPGRFRWAYEQPYEQLMVCDGQKIWLYDPDLSQVTVRPASEALGGTPAALLAQRASLTEEFVLEGLGSQNGAGGVRMKPKSDDSDFSAIEFWLLGEAPERMVFHDRLGNRTDVRFSGVQINAKVDEALLRFKPPKGAEVIESSAGASRE